MHAVPMERICTLYAFESTYDVHIGLCMAVCHVSLSGQHVLRKPSKVHERRSCMSVETGTPMTSGSLLSSPSRRTISGNMHMRNGTQCIVIIDIDHQTSYR